MFKGKNILVGVCGSIAAYKAAYLVRLLVKNGGDVRLILTADAQNFITPLTLSTLSKNPVLTEYFDPKTGQWNNHIELAEWADVFLIAPISANTLAKLANGICENLLAACYLSAKCPVLLAPAMDLDMWEHPATVSNIQTLKSYGNLIINPEEGELASGLYGKGRLAEPEHIVSILNKAINKATNKRFLGKRALVTAGPTYESIDPVRFIGNRSSGKMGFELARYLQNEGAEVTLISGPTSLTTPLGVKRIDIMDSKQMLEQCLTHFPGTDITIMSAAVSDYTPLEVADQKIKKSASNLTIELQKSTDILATLGKQKKDGQILIGFALETENENENAISKLKRKKLDFIVLNSLNDPGAGFEKDTNKITIIHKNGEPTAYPQKSKSQVARDISNEILNLK